MKLTVGRIVLFRDYDDIPIEEAWPAMVVSVSDDDAELRVFTSTGSFGVRVSLEENNLSIKVGPDPDDETGATQFERADGIWCWPPRAE